MVQTPESKMRDPDARCPNADVCETCIVRLCRPGEMCMPAERYGIELRRLMMNEDMRIVTARPIAMQRSGLMDDES